MVVSVNSRLSYGRMLQAPPRADLKSWPELSRGYERPLLKCREFAERTLKPQGSIISYSVEMQHHRWIISLIRKDRPARSIPESEWRRVS